MRDVIESIKQCVIRFFDSKFTSYDDGQEHIRTVLMQLEKERDEKIELNRFIMSLMKKEEFVETGPVEDFKPILPKNMSWRTRQAMLEREDREKKLQISKSVSTEELEKELLGEE